MALQARMEHNARVRMASIASEGRRARFLLNHIEVLLPFITPQAAAHIRCAPTCITHVKDCS